MHFPCAQAQAGLLLHGTYDEAGASSGFAEAVQAWRHQHSAAYAPPAAAAASDSRTAPPPELPAGFTSSHGGGCPMEGVQPPGEATLLEGAYDGARAAQEFREAVLAWRSAAKPAATVGAASPRQEAASAGTGMQTAPRQRAASARGGSYFARNFLVGAAAVPCIAAPAGGEPQAVSPESDSDCTASTGRPATVATDAARTTMRAACKGAGAPSSPFSAKHAGRAGIAATADEASTSDQDQPSLDGPARTKAACAFDTWLMHQEAAADEFACLATGGAPAPMTLPATGGCMGGAGGGTIDTAGAQYQHQVSMLLQQLEMLEAPAAAGAQQAGGGEQHQARQSRPALVAEQQVWHGDAGRLPDCILAPPAAMLAQ